VVLRKVVQNGRSNRKKCKQGFTVLQSVPLVLKGACLAACSFKTWLDHSRHKCFAALPCHDLPLIDGSILF
jgi:hypothetical protein